MEDTFISKDAFLLTVPTQRRDMSQHPKIPWLRAGYCGNEEANGIKLRSTVLCTAIAVIRFVKSALSEEKDECR